MQQKFDFSSVRLRALEYLKEERKYHAGSCRRYSNHWSHIRKYMEVQQLTLISSQVCQDFLLNLHNKRQYTELSTREKEWVKAARVLAEFIETGEIRKRVRKFPLDGLIGILMKGFLEVKQAKRLSKLRMEKIESHLSKFNIWLSINDVREIKEIEQKHIVGFIKSLDPNKKALICGTLSDVKNFFQYCYEQSLITINLAAFIPKVNYDSKSKIPSYYTEEEIGQLLNSIDRATKVGKRDYAILLMGSHLGLRASDIALLKFESIRWESSTIYFKQYKTGKELSLPLIPVVGNALLEYIQYGRPQSDEQYIFLRARTPFSPITSLAVSCLASRRFTHAGIKTDQRKHGAHALRHSLVKELLKNRETLPVITEVLGHKNGQSTRHYIRIDTESLRQCALEVPKVDTDFYTQQNGILFL